MQVFCTQPEFLQYSKYKILQLKELSVSALLNMYLFNLCNSITSVDFVRVDSLNLHDQSMDCVRCEFDCYFLHTDDHLT